MASIRSRKDSPAPVGQYLNEPNAQSASHRQGPPAPLLVTAPAVVVALLLLVPTIYLIVRACGAGSDAWDLLSRPRTLVVLKNTVALAVAVSTTSVVVAVPLAWLTVRTNLPGRQLWASLAALPLVVPSYVGALTIIAALGPRGMVQHWLSDPLDVERLPSIYGFGGAWFALTLFTYPYVFLTVRAALRGLDPCLEEAARSLGRGAWRTFFTITLPRLRPAIVAGALLTALYTIGDFGVVTLLRFDAFTRVIYTQYRSSFDRSSAAVLSLVLVALAIVLVTFEVRLRGKGAYYRLGSGSARVERRVNLGRWRWPAMAYCLSIIGLSIGLPLAVLIYWFARGWARGEQIEELASATWHSFSLGVVAAVVTIVAAFPIAMLSVRYGGRLGRLIERICYLAYGLPGIVIALSFVFIGANFLTPIYQTLPLLILAYLVRFLPQALGAERASLLQISPRLEEAARNLGRTSLGAISSITAPLARPGIGAGAILVFLTVMKELPMTLLLSPTGYKTLATQIWTATGSGRYGEAALPALILIGVSSLPTLWMATREQPRGGRES